MLLHRHIVNPSKVALFSDLSGGNYPVGLAVEDFLYLFSDARAFKISAFAFIDDSLARQAGSSDIAGQLDSLNSIGQNPLVNLTAQTARQIIPIGKLDKNGKELIASPNTMVDYPLHIGGNQDGTLTIDFGKTLLTADLLMPWIQIDFSNGFTSKQQGTIVGGVSFLNYGFIPIYSGTVDVGLVIGSAGGKIELAENYSSLISKTIFLPIGGQLILETDSDMQNLSLYSQAFFGAASSSILGAQKQLTIKVPENAKSGPVRIEASSPQFDSFLTYQEFIVS